MSGRRSFLPFPAEVPGGGGSGGNTVPSTWTSVPAGGSAVIAPGVAYAGAFDTTGARDFAPLPAGAQDGQVVILKAVGASNTDGILVTPAAGQSVEDPGTPGTVLAPNATALVSGQGQSVTYKYQLAGNRWLIAANA
jgi:hypothetical protein